MSFNTMLETLLYTKPQAQTSCDKSSLFFYFLDDLREYYIYIGLLRAQIPRLESSCRDETRIRSRGEQI